MKVSPQRPGSPVRSKQSGCANDFFSNVTTTVTSRKNVPCADHTCTKFSIVTSQWMRIKFFDDFLVNVPQEFYFSVKMLLAQ